MQKYYQDGELKGWRGVISYGYNDNGTLKRKQFYGNTKQKVLDKMTEFKYKNNTGLLPSDDKITLQEWFFTWLFDFRVNDLKPSSFERYEGIYRNYIKSAIIGKIKLADLRAPHIQSYYNDLIGNGISITTVKTVNKFLGTCLGEALKQGFIRLNYCKSVKLPKESSSNAYDVFTPKEQSAFTEAIKGHHYELAFKLNLGTGLRLGELLALKWAGIDLQGSMLTVSKSIKRVTYRQAGK